jgi:hypothetical protein
MIVLGSRTRLDAVDTGSAIGPRAEAKVAGRRPDGVRPAPLTHGFNAYFYEEAVTVSSECALAIAEPVAGGGPGRIVQVRLRAPHTADPVLGFRRLVIAQRFLMRVEVMIPVTRAGMPIHGLGWVTSYDVRLRQGGSGRGRRYTEGAEHEAGCEDGDDPHRFVSPPRTMIARSNMS